MNLNQKLVSLLKRKKLKISFAESCTGGLLSSSITSVNGSSRIFSMGLVTYSNQAKITVLKVHKKIIEKYGAVSIQCCLAMLNNLSKISKSNFIDGVNSSVVGYYILVILSILFLSKIYTLNINQDLFIKLLIVLSVLYLCNIFGIIFLGDSGSYLLAYIVGLSLIDFYNNNPIVSPYYLVCLLWYPAYENLFSIIRKFITKKSPSKADNHHLHHYIYAHKYEQRYFQVH